VGTLTLKDIINPGEETSFIHSDHYCISIIAFILNKLGLDEVFIVLKKTDMFYFVLACLSYLFLNLILASRLSYLVTKTGHEIKFRDVFLSHMGE